jgi:hypothetical protein
MMREHLTLISSFLQNLQLKHCFSFLFSNLYGQSLGTLCFKKAFKPEKFSGYFILNDE